MNSEREGTQMSTYNLQLLDSPGNYDEGTLPFGSRAYIALKASSEVTWQDKAGKKISFTVITPECVTADEFRYQVRRLRKELETIERHAEAFFA